ncbi:hypothetical protein WJX75_008687 [Coccomyxa subellipsoidea]|uniref:DUF819-domain-containing protein n=1 Tax=Coccomyxa subellipsoidea TaxID=248742 RepID=A0ABR2YT12_9CHLO
MLAIIAGMTCSSVGLLPLQSPIYEAVWEFLMPLAAALLLLEANFTELLSVARTTTVAFSVAAFATIVGTFVAFALLGQKLGADGWKLSVHLALSISLGKLFRLPTQALLTASNAAVGGPATAAAMCTSRGWRKMVTPALLVGTLGYAIGTPIGMLVAFVLKNM